MPSAGDRSDFPAYYWRWRKPYVARFCSPDLAESFLEYGSDPVEDHVSSFLAAVGDTPEPGVDYKDVGHEYCGGDECPDGAP